MSKFWEVKQQADEKALNLYIYTAVEGNAYDFWRGEEVQSETSADFFRDKLAEYPDIQQINLYINSLGGSVLEGMAIYNQLLRHPAKVTAYIDGFACSIASVIAMSADKVVMPKSAVMMVHNMWTTISGNASELRKCADDLDLLNKISKNAYLEKSKGKISPEKLTELMDSETYLTAEQCIEYGLADEYLASTQGVPRKLEQYARKIVAMAEPPEKKATDIILNYFK